MGNSRWLFWFLIIAVVGTFAYERDLVQRRNKTTQVNDQLDHRVARLPDSTTSLGTASELKGPQEPTTADQVRIQKKAAQESNLGVDALPLGDQADESEIPEWGNPTKLAKSKTQKITELFPEAKDLPLPDLLSHLAVTDFQTTGPVVFEGADENYHEYDQNGPHGEQVQKYFSPEGGLAIEQINYSQHEQIVKRYSPQSALAEVSYEYKNQGGVLRFQPDGTVESFHTWDQNNNQILTRYNTAGQATEVWQWTPESDWKQVR